MGQSRVLYRIGQVICAPVFKLIYRQKYINRNSFPKEGGFIVACNHLSFSDPVLLGLGQLRRMYFMAKSELFENKAFAALIRALGAFPVERGKKDNKAIKTGADLIREGKVMTIFIEGGRSRSGELMRPRSGCALLAQQMRVPVIPVCITVVGNPKHTFARRVIHYGEPLPPERLGLTTDGGRRELKNATDIIMGEIRKIREQDLNEYKRR